MPYISKCDIRLKAAELFGDGMLMSWKAKRSSLQEGARELAAKKPPRIIVATCPDYGNLGDQAIAYAERLYLTRHLSCPTVMLYGPLQRQWRALVAQVHPEDIICLQGGGSLGTLYECYENERLAIIDKFRRNKILLFPHTFSYGESDYEHRYLQHMRTVYNRHPDLHLIAREKMSYNRMRECFPNADIVLTPDIVLSLSPQTSEGSIRQGIYLCLREDKERKMGANGLDIINRAANKRFEVVIRTDTMYPSNFLTPEEGEAAVRAKIAELSRAQLVITDRIHGMIFCALSGTPCIALDNSNGKVGHEYEWLKGLSYMHFARDAEEAAVMIGGADIAPGCFPSEEFASLFDPITEILLGGCHGKV